ncbi:SSU ribosomal protein S17p (S11e) [Minicystis rosea]|nr:SSU ribosomal protein S17p (S11e) [Minicystis rosea]
MAKKPEKKEAPAKGAGDKKAPPAKAAAPAAAAKAAPAKAAAPAAAPAPAAKAAPAPIAAAPAPAAAAPAPAAEAAPVAERHGFRRKLVGRVTSNKMSKTVVVEVVRSSLDPVYKKYVRVRDRYKAHDETNQYKVGDRVEITEHRPISRDKRWLVTKLITRAVEE